MKYRLPNSRRPRSNGFSWLLVMLAFAVVAWMWWRADHASSRKGAQKPAPTSATPPRPAAAPPKGSADTTANGASTAVKAPSPRPPQSVLDVQLALERQGISSGPLDGILGSQTRAAIRAFQRKAKLPPTGELDAETKSLLLPAAPLLTAYTVTTNDLVRLQPLSKTWQGKSQQSALDYETILELVAEKSHAHPDLLRRLNPDADWTNLVAGTVLQVPDLSSTNISLPAKAAFITISLTNKVLEAFDDATNLLLHFPCSIAQRVEKRPVGELSVAAIAPNPNYTFDPEVFPESPEAQQLKTKLILQPGPNNPVGTVWISLDRPGYGIHGTPNPEAVGRTESHGCFRLANWNAERLLNLVWVGMPVFVEP